VIPKHIKLHIYSNALKQTIKEIGFNKRRNYSLSKIKRTIFDFNAHTKARALSTDICSKPLSINLSFYVCALSTKVAMLETRELNRRQQSMPLGF